MFLTMAGAINGNRPQSKHQPRSEWVDIGIIYGGKAWMKHAPKLEHKTGDFESDRENLWLAIFADLNLKSHGLIISGSGGSFLRIVDARRGHLWEARDYLKRGAQKWHFDLKLLEQSKNLAFALIEAK